jgi:hypothetical protein
VDVQHVRIGRSNSQITGNPEVIRVENDSLHLTVETLHGPEVGFDEVGDSGIQNSVIISTRGVWLLPVYAQNFLPSSVTSRPLKGDSPTVDLVLGYRKSNQSPILKLLLSRLDELVARVSKGH